MGLGAQETDGTCQRAADRILFLFFCQHKWNSIGHKGV